MDGSDRKYWQKTDSTPSTIPSNNHPTIPPLDFEQTAKGLVVAVSLFFAFLFLPIPREVLALAGAGALLTSRKLYSKEMLNLVDWQILVLFTGLFVVNHAFQSTGIPGRALLRIREAGFDIQSLDRLFVITAVLSNIVSNVPAVMLLIPAAGSPSAPLVLAISSTLAGNLLIVGSITNIIVADTAERTGVSFTYRIHAKTGIPITILSLAIAGFLIT